MSADVNSATGNRSRPVAGESGRDAVPAALEALAERIGDFIQYWGFKRIHGRVWCHLYLAGGPVDAGWLMRRLGISKTLVSTTLKELRGLGAIGESGLSRRGTQLFQASPRIVAVILNVLKSREQRLMASTRAAAQNLGRLTPAELRAAWVDPQRARQLVALVETGSTLLERLIALRVLDLSALEAFNSDWPMDTEGRAR
jgi:DNA-binding transcriptional regulator GbsR (MarR family)